MPLHRIPSQPHARVSLRELLHRPRHRGKYRPQPNWRTHWKTDAYGNPYITTTLHLFGEVAEAQFVMVGDR
jgi:hypothetical protein